MIDGVDLLGRLFGKAAAWPVGRWLATLSLIGAVVASVRAAVRRVVPATKRAAWARLFPRATAVLDMIEALGLAAPRVATMALAAVTGRHPDAPAEPTAVVHDAEPGRSGR